MTRKALAITLAALAGATMAAPARADLITIDTINATWQNVVGGTNVNGVGTDSIRWGTGSPQSGYDWDPRVLPFVAPSEVPFSLGIFTHVNFPIGLGTSITGADLDFTEIGTFQSPLTLAATFNFAHNETNNNPNGGVCTFGGVPPCPDVVVITNPLLNAPVVYNNINHFFTLLGFSTDGGNTISTEFITLESANNSADLYAIITHEPVGEVPEPTSLVLIGSGLLAAAARRRLRR